MRIHGVSDEINDGVTDTVMQTKMVSIVGIDEM